MTKPPPEKDGSTLCRRCRHFFVTWDSKHPNGCRVLAFKSKSLPCVDVYATSGLACQAFERKHNREPKR